MAAASEHMGPSTNVEALSDAVLCINLNAIHHTPRLLVTMSERASERLIACIDKLDPLLLEYKELIGEELSRDSIDIWKRDVGMVDTAQSILID